MFHERRGVVCFEVPAKETGDVVLPETARVTTLTGSGYKLPILQANQSVMLSLDVHKILKYRNQLSAP